MGRTTIIQTLDERSQDYRHYAEQGWFESDYFYPTHLGPLKNAAGSLFDSLATIETRRRRGAPVT